MADATVKSEPVDTDVPMRAADEEDIYEDAGDLEFWDKTAHSSAYNSVYMARLPKSVWDAWNGIKDDEEVQIGSMRVWNDPKTAQPKMELLLHERPEHQMLPKEYTFEITDNVQNTFIFTEQDLPGFKNNKNRTGADAAGRGGLPIKKPGGGPGAASGGAGASSRVDKSHYKKRGRYQPYYRKAIPKKTRVFGNVKYSVVAKPLKNAESQALMDLRTEEALKPKHQIQSISKFNPARMLHAGTRLANQWNDKFVAAPPKPTKAKKMELKAARIPKNQLLDLIFDLYREFQYWPLRALRQRLQQPESYLRQTLDEIAVLHKAGRFANLWSLKPEYSVGTAGADVAAEIAPDTAEDDGSEADEMEDVLPA